MIEAAEIIKKQIKENVGEMLENKKPSRQRPTYKQRKFAKKVLIEGKSKRQAAKEAGYADSIAKNPKKITESKGWETLQEEFLPDPLLAQRHQELLNANYIQHYVFPKMTTEVKKGRKTIKGTLLLSDEEIKVIVESVPGCKLIYIKADSFNKIAFFQAPDNRGRKDALDMAYKLTGKYAEQKHKHSFEGKNLEELREMLAERIARILTSDKRD